MRRPLDFVFLAVASALEKSDLMDKNGHGRNRPPAFSISTSDCSNTSWASGISRPTKDRPPYLSLQTTITEFSSSLSLGPVPQITTTQSGLVSISTVFLTKIVTWIETITLPAPYQIPTTITVERTLPLPSTKATPAQKTHESHSPICQASGVTQKPDAASCNGRNCEITFEKGAVVHWELLSNHTPLVTHYLHSTCVAVVCNTTEFSRYYYRSATSCDLPPCPSNSLNCECNIVVGPIRLPDGRITSVTQTGPSGWNLNLGPTATARNIGHCGPNGAECLSAMTTTLFTPLVYTDTVEVVRPTGYKNHTGATATEFLLPKLTDYFPANDPLGMCTTVVLSEPAKNHTLRQRDDVATVGGDGVTTWPGCETLTDDANAKRGLVVRQTQDLTSVPLPICSSTTSVSTTAVTATALKTGTTTAVESQVPSAAANSKWQHIWAAWLPILLIYIGQL